MKYKYFRSAVLWSALAVSAFTACAQQTIEFMSIKAKQGMPAILEHRAEYTDKLTGVLTYPAGATGKVPAMIIMHSSGGINESTWQWSKFFLDMGIATFVVDSFHPRGIDTTTTDQSQLNPIASVADALTALKTLADQPGIDSKRIGVIGFSRGAVAAVISSFENVRAGVLGEDSKLAFAVHVAYYGGCINYGKTAGAPILSFIGKKDDYYAWETCANAVDNLRAKGANIVNFTVYPGVYHGFDVERDKQVYIGNAQTSKNCGKIGYDSDEKTYQVDAKVATSKEFGDYFGKCMSRGATVSYDRQATLDSRAQTKALLIKVFGL